MVEGKIPGTIIDLNLAAGKLSEIMFRTEPVDVLARLKSNDRLALKELFQLYYGMVCKTIRRFIHDDALCEDLAQEVFLRFWEKRNQLEISSSLEGYLRRMAVNEALAYLRRRKYFEEEITPSTPAETLPSGEEHLLHSELESNIRSAIDTLPPKCKTVFQLSRFEELTYQEIADHMGISIKTVENQMGKALKIIREKLSGYLHLFL